MIEKETKKHISNYNKAINDLIHQLSMLKISENAQTLNTKALEHQKSQFSVIISRENCNKLERFFERVYDSHIKTKH